MKIIEAMKKVKELIIKADDLRKKIGQHAANLDFETPVYQDQATQVSGWLQSHSDIVKEIGRLQFAIQKTNVATPIQVALGDNLVTKTLAEWLGRRGPKNKLGLAALELQAWSALTDRQLREGDVQLTREAQPITVKIRRFYDPLTRDQKIALYRSEPLIIDAAIEVANATTELIET